MKHNGKEIKIKHELFPKLLQGVIGGITFNEDCFYLVVIDSSRCPITQRQILGHELAHIYLGHLDSDATSYSLSELSDYNDFIEKQKNVAFKGIERQANKAAWHYYRVYKDSQLMKKDDT